MKAVIYVRVSTQEQANEGYSIPAQISILRGLSKTYNYDVIKIYQDAGISGKNIKDRPAMMELIEDAKNKKFDVVLVWKLSRLSRSLLDLLSIVDMFTQNNISFQSYSEKFDTSSPMGKMLLQLLGSIAEFERNTIAENVKMGLNERFKQGHSKGAIPFGYKNVNKQAVIVPEQAEIVKMVFKTYMKSNGECLTLLAEQLNDNGFMTRTGGLWNRLSIRDMLQNHFYAGYVRTGIHSHGYSRKADASIIKGAHEPIIEDKVFNIVNDKLQSMKQRTVIRQPDNESILTGLVVCPRCGAKMFALNTYNSYTTKGGTTNRYPIRMYRCNNHDKGNGCCKGFYISSNKIEPCIIPALKNYLDTYNPEDYVSVKPQSEEENNDMTILERKLKHQISIRDKYFRLFESGNVQMELFSDKINEILDKISKMEKEKEQLIRKNKPKNFRIVYTKINNFSELYYNLTNIERKDFIRNFVDEVHISLDKKVTELRLTNGESILLS